MFPFVDEDPGHEGWWSNPATFNFQAKNNDEWFGNYRRVEFKASLALKAGAQDITLRATLKAKDLLEIRALEVTPTAAVAALQADHDAAVAARASTDWLVEAKYGVMFHWTDETAQTKNVKLGYAEAVVKFDVGKFVAMVQSTGAKYVIFTLNHQHPHCPAPVKEWEDMFPGWTTQRDLIQEIIDGLKAVGIKFMMYLATHLIGMPKTYGYDESNGEAKWLKAHQFGNRKTSLAKEMEVDQYFDIFENAVRIMAVLGKRYGADLAAFWLDGWDIVPEVYPHHKWRRAFEAAKQGNPDRPANQR